MEHSFDTDIAKEIGIQEAIIFKHIAFWIQKNQANGENFYDGETWTYNSVKAFNEIFYYMSPKVIRNALSKLEELDLIKTGNYNKIQFDRTKWYALTEKGKSICQKREIHLPKRENGSCPKGEPIPDINTDIDTDNNKSFTIVNDSSDSDRVRQDIQRAVEEWNSLEPLGYSRISRMTTSSQRYKWLRARIVEYGIEDVVKAIDNVRNSSYLRDAPWFAFDWFVRPNNFPKVLEGKYSRGNDSTTHANDNSFLRANDGRQ